MVLPSEAPPAAPAATLRSVLRRATQEDVRQANDLRLSEEDVRRQVLEKVRQHKLEMKVSDAEWQWDRSKLTLYFTAEKRVDFRALVRDLASTFRTRIELRQIGVRDEAARLGGVGRCGREYCSAAWLPDLRPVNLGVAKDQRLSLNPSQISGACGRLMCCLSYELAHYRDSLKMLPPVGTQLKTGQGMMTVMRTESYQQAVWLKDDEGAEHRIGYNELPPGPYKQCGDCNCGKKDKSDGGGGNGEAPEGPGSQPGDRK